MQLARPTSRACRITGVYVFVRILWTHRSIITAFNEQTNVLKLTPSKKDRKMYGETAADSKNIASNSLQKHRPAKSKPHNLLRLLIIIWVWQQDGICFRFVLRNWPGRNELKKWARQETKAQTILTWHAKYCHVLLQAIIAVRHRAWASFTG